MGTSTLDNIKEKEISPKEIREMLGIDNSQIQELCKMADIKLKRNKRGLTYFTQDEAKTLKSVSSEFNTQKSSKKFQDNEQSRNIDSSMQNNGASEDKVTKPIVHSGSHTITASSVMQLVETLKNIENNITDKLKNVLDEKLDGMDDVVLELIRVKTENETMRFKINELNKENYKLKKEINSFKKVPFGFYAKTTPGNRLF